MKLRKVFQFRMRPTAEQAQSLVRLAGARRFAWNWALAQCRAYYVETGKSLQAELSRRLTALKRLPETAWLSESDWQALQQVLADLHRAYVKQLLGLARTQSRQLETARRSSSVGCCWPLPAMIPDSRVGHQGSRQGRHPRYRSQTPSAAPGGTEGHGRQ